MCSTYFANAIKAPRRNVKEIYNVEMSTKRSFNPLGIIISSMCCQQLPALLLKRFQPYQ